MFIFYQNVLGLYHNIHIEHDKANIIVDDIENGKNDVDINNVENGKDDDMQK